MKTRDKFKDYMCMLREPGAGCELGTSLWTIMCILRVSDGDENSGQV